MRVPAETENNGDSWRVKIDRQLALEVIMENGAPRIRVPANVRSTDFMRFFDLGTITVASIVAAGGVQTLYTPSGPEYLSLTYDADSVVLSEETGYGIHIFFDGDEQIVVSEAVTSTSQGRITSSSVKAGLVVSTGPMFRTPEWTPNTAKVALVDGIYDGIKVGDNYWITADAGTTGAEMPSGLSDTPSLFATVSDNDLTWVFLGPMIDNASLHVYSQVGRF